MRRIYRTKKIKRMVQRLMSEYRTNLHTKEVKVQQSPFISTAFKELRYERQRD